MCILPPPHRLYPADFADRTEGSSRHELRYSTVKLRL
jgi:hypothetical protein